MMKIMSAAINTGFFFFFETPNPIKIPKAHKHNFKRAISDHWHCLINSLAELVNVFINTASFAVTGFDWFS